VDGATSWAVAAISRRDDGSPRAATVPLSRLRIQGAPAYSFSELYTGAGPVNISADLTLSFRVPPSGTVSALRTE